MGGIFLGLTAAGLIGQVFGALHRYQTPSIKTSNPNNQPRQVFGCIIPSYYLYGKNFKRANTLFSYMISKGVVQIVVASTLLDKVCLVTACMSRKNITLNLFSTIFYTAPHNRLQGPHRRRHIQRNDPHGKCT